MPEIVTRFAPSPSGHLHLGHAYAALFAWRLADRPGGEFILRIEDIDGGRNKAEYEDAIYEDLAWLGIKWREPVMRQSERGDAYKAALDKLADMDLLYPCFCTRKDILAEINSSAGAPHSHSAYGPIYPGICRDVADSDRTARIDDGTPYALRLDVAKALAIAGDLTWHDRSQGEQQVQADLFGDVVLARKDIATSYHLAVTVDDAAQGITLVNRGVDLFESTHVHRLLQALLGLDAPEWHHTPMLTDPSGKRLAKRDNPLTLREMRANGAAGDTIWVQAIQSLARQATAVEGI
ncbi:MAG: tRNA glutamyl-Q(34) synthetase GluQRS [Alphaproteobacteria bacterium]|nr:tRNA glutamyl-Q(34) synthetase GluQRS [Alphaproteobacteria bacterium]